MVDEAHAGTAGAVANAGLTVVSCSCRSTWRWPDTVRTSASRRPCGGRPGTRVAAQSRMDSLASQSGRIRDGVRAPEEDQPRRDRMDALPLCDSEAAVRVADPAQSRDAAAEREMPTAAREQVACSPPARGRHRPPTAISSVSPGGAGAWSSGIEAREFVQKRSLMRLLAVSGGFGHPLKQHWRERQLRPPLSATISRLTGGD